VVIQHHYENPHAFIFIVMLVLFLCFKLLIKNKKNMQITIKSQKYIFFL